MEKTTTTHTAVANCHWYRIKVPSNVSHYLLKAGPSVRFMSPILWGTSSTYLKYILEVGIRSMSDLLQVHTSSTYFKYVLQVRTWSTYLKYVLEVRTWSTPKNWTRNKSYILEVSHTYFKYLLEVRTWSTYLKYILEVHTWSTYLK